MFTRFALLCLFGMLAAPIPAAGIDASPPGNVALSVYDAGFALVSELRRITPAMGDNQIRFRSLPSRLDPSTVSFISLTGPPGFEVLEQQYVHDVNEAPALLRRYKGRRVEVVTSSGAVTGRLLSVPDWSLPVSERSPLVLAGEGDAAHVFVNPDQIQHIVLPGLSRHAHLEPTLIWRARAAQEGPQNIRLTYRADQIDWQAAYEVALNEEGTHAYFAGRIGLHNRSGGRFENAQVHLVSTEKGAVQERRTSAVARGARDASTASMALRYGYGMADPSFEVAVASLSPIHTYRLSQPVTLDDGDLKFVQYGRSDRVPMNRFYVYDGVRFDRFQRFRRNDWNYGTEHHTTVETHLRFTNDAQEGLGIDLPSGRLRLYQQRADGTVELIGEDLLLGTAVGETGHVLVGPARGLRGERERTGYAEVTPLRVYEESFEIRLENNTEDPVEIRVVEHLYRWHDFEIVRADAEYELTDDQTIEFRPSLRPGGRRTIQYTVRYSW